MAKNAGKLVLHMVSSLDGFVAKTDNSIDWMHSTDHFEQGDRLNEEDIKTFLNKIDCYVMGSKTYEHALLLGWPYGDTPVYVLSSRPLHRYGEQVSFYSGDIQRLVNEKLKPTFEEIWLVGGSACAKDFLNQQLVDEIVHTIMPIILGDGLLGFNFVSTEQILHLIDVTAYQNGMVELWYEVQT